MLKGTGQSNWENYLDHIGLFFIFTACAGISIIVWVFNWVCWINQCCCCDFLHNPINKRIAWWMSFSFLLGVLACCISAFFTVNRFGFALEGAWCAVDRIYYDSLYGQLKTSEPKWEGFIKLKTVSDYLFNFYDSVRQSPDGYLANYLLNNIDATTTWGVNPILNIYFLNSDDADIVTNNEKKLFLLKFTKLINSIKQLSQFTDTNPSQKDALNSYINQGEFEKIKTEFLEKFYYYSKRLKACLKVLAMVYYCLLLIVITAAGVSMMFFACLKRQGYLLLLMKVLWNVIRFFMFSFFLYGTAYGIGFLSIRDSVGYIMYVFNENLDETVDNIKLVANGKEFFKFCLRDDSSNLKTKFEEIYATSLNDFFTNYREIKESSYTYGNVKDNLKKFTDEITGGANAKITSSQFEYLYNEAGKKAGVFSTFDCGFLKSDLNLLYTAIYDASVESRILSALSLCSAFFGAVAVYFYLLVMHHYDNELFFDNGKSIFTGFDGFGGGYRKKNEDQDPAYKKRKLRAEIEITSNNEEQNGYKAIKDVNKNDEED